MILPEKTAELVSTIESLIQNKDESEAYEVIRQNPLIFSHLPEHMRDDRQIALVAMGKLLQTGNNASKRLKKDIGFFIEAFNLYFSRPPIAPTSIRDIVFMLAFAKSYFHYWHEVSQTELAEYFQHPSYEVEKNVNEANTLINAVENYGSWLSDNRENDITTLKNSHANFSQFVFEYAFMWAYGTRSMKRTFEHGIW